MDKYENITNLESLRANQDVELKLWTKSHFYFDLKCEKGTITRKYVLKTLG